MDGTKRQNIMTGDYVKIVLKEDQRTGRLTDGFVKDILTKFPQHHHGIKVRLSSGEIGRVKEIFKDR
ncbi:MAG TPA: YwbE family protein [Ignavibacteriaceae bacterium]|nr:YwbE family protein [Ignavibacteriaceae bacterium]